MEINKTVIVASRWFLYYLTYIDDARSNTNQEKESVKLLVGGRGEKRKEETKREGDRESTAEEQRTVETTVMRRILSASSPLDRVSLGELCRLEEP